MSGRQSRAAARTAAALPSILLSAAIFLQYLDLAAAGVEVSTGARALVAYAAAYLLGLGELIVVCAIWFAYGRAARRRRLRAAVLKVTLWEGLAAVAYLPARLLVWLPVARAAGDGLIDSYRLPDLLTGGVGVILVATAVAVPWRARRTTLT